VNKYIGRIYGWLRHRRYFEHKVYDFETAVDAFMQQLNELQLHVAEHDFIEDADDVVAEIEHALRLWEQLGAEFDYEVEDRLWNELWDHVKANGRKWWC